MSLTIPPNKSFTEDFNILVQTLKDGENFAFARFSDGEVYMLQGVEIDLASDHVVVGDIIRGPAAYPRDEWKHYEPAKHEFYRQKLEEAFTHRQANYFKGVSCRCCVVGQPGFNWQMDLLKRGYDHIDYDHLTWANLCINANYVRFVKEVIPILKTRKIVIMVNENAILSPLEFNIVKDFRVGFNCVVNNYPSIELMSKWIEENNIVDHVFLFAAASLSNLAIHQLYLKHPNNTYIDIGSNLNPFMPGVGGHRAYMDQEKTGRQFPVCIW